MTITQPEILERNWGTEAIVVWTPTHAGKILTRKAGTKGGYQLHIKEESHYVVSGKLKLEWMDADGEHEQIVEAGSAWTIQPGAVHREEALDDSVVFEVSDPTRDDRYPIVPDPGGLPPMTSLEAWAKLVDLSDALAHRAVVCDDLARRIRRQGIESLLPATVAK